LSPNTSSSNTIATHAINTPSENSPQKFPPRAFGPKLTALLSLLTGVYHLAKREAKQLIQNLYDIDIGTGSIPNIEEKITKALTPVYERIHHFAIQSASCKHFDETSWRNSGEKHYVWIATTQHAALYKIHPNRSKKAFEELALGKCTFQAVTDRYATYNTLGKDHQYCLAHLIRECHRWQGNRIIKIS
jgi:transposase